MLSFQIPSSCLLDLQGPDGTIRGVIAPVWNSHNWRSFGSDNQIDEHHWSEDLTQLVLLATISNNSTQSESEI